MDVSSVIQNNNAQNAGSGGEKSPGAAARVAVQGGGTSAQTDLAVQAALKTVSQELGRGLPDNQRVRTQLRFDNDAARIVAEVVDTSTGNVVDSFPPDLVLKVIARNRDMLGPLVDFST